MPKEEERKERPKEGRAANIAVERWAKKVASLLPLT